MQRIAVVGYGNIGKQAVQTIAREPDMELAGVVRRDAREIPAELSGITVAEDIQALGKVDAAILSVPSRSVPELAKKYLALGINTVDCYDVHGSIPELCAELDAAVKAGGAAAIVSAGWDPGSDSLVRALLEICAPRGITYTNFGPGMSMGHSVAARAVPGVKAALSVTIPIGTGLHRRLVYIELAPGAELSDVSERIKSDPYFVHDETIVTAVPDVSAIADAGHGVNMTRKGVSGVTHNQNFEFNMSINNPALSAQILTAAARACVKREPGAYTLIEVPIIDLLPGEKEDIIRRLV